MITKVFGILLFIAVSVNGDNSTKSNDLKNEIHRPELGSLQQQLLNIGSAYSIPKGMSLSEFYKNHREKHLGEEEIKSVNYPKPYRVGTSKKYRISVENGTGIEVIINDLDIDPIVDFLKISPVNEDGTLKPGMIFTGQLHTPTKLRLLQMKKMEIEFGAFTQSGHNHKGFWVTYYPYGNHSDHLIPTPRPNRTVSFDDLEAYSVYLIIPKAQQNNKTWETFRKLLSISSNKFIKSNKLPLEECHENNVTIKSIIKCPELWANSAECIDLTFAINLYSLDDEEVASNPIVQESKDPGGFTRDQLKKIWIRYGKSTFLASKYNEYQLPDAKTSILIWTGIGFGVVLMALIILIILCRISVLQDYWPTADDDKQNILKATPEMDISMFPSPDQVVPPLFPFGVSGYNNSENRVSFRETVVERKPTENDALKSSVGFGGGVFNQGFIEDEDSLRKRQNYQTYVHGVNTDEATT